MITYSPQVTKKANLYIDKLRDRWMDKPERWDTEALRTTLCELIYSCCGDCVPYEGEPKFVLLGRDPQAPDLILEWAETRLAIEPTATEKCESARLRANEMLFWKSHVMTLGLDYEAYLEHLNSRTSRVKWVVTNSEGDKFGIWDGGPTWSKNIDQALKFADRESAEKYCADDEDAWRVVAIPDHTPLTDAQRKTAADAIAEYVAESIKTMPKELRRVADTFPDNHWDRNVLMFMADLVDPPVNRVLNSREQIAEAIADVADAVLTLSIPEDGPKMVLVDDTDPVMVLQLFREFVTRNATQWVMGAGDHHHPMWELVATAIENGSEILPEADLHRGTAYAFIQPTNRKPWSEFAQSQELDNGAV